MEWKKYPYWLKTGLIFALIVFILIMINGLFFGEFSGYYSEYGNYLDIILQIPGEILLSPLGLTQCIYQSLPGEDYSWCPKKSILKFIVYFSTIIFYFLVGVIIGLIIGKLKSKNK